jgi:hypothetical protein
MRGMDVVSSENLFPHPALSQEEREMHLNGYSGFFTLLRAGLSRLQDTEIQLDGFHQ